MEQNTRARERRNPILITTRIIEHKAARIRAGESPRVLDLFSGCGGLFLGFHRASCTSLGGVELDPFAAASFARNFHPSIRTGIHASPKNIEATDPLDLLRSLGHRHPARVVDYVVGGPPCPAFARVGRAKLREIHRHPTAYRQDPRAKLYLPYLQYVRALQPVAILMENVPDVLNYGGHNLGEEICEALEDLGYRAIYTLLNAASYGVPQYRERFFMLAIHEAASTWPVFPPASHEVRFPAGYISSRQVALRQTPTKTLFETPQRYVSAPEPSAAALPAVTALEAMIDLPPVTGHLEGTDRRGARRFDVAVGYRPGVRPSTYAKELREWPGFETTGQIFDHVTRCLGERDQRLFRNLNAGDDYPAAFALAEQFLEAELARLHRDTGVTLGPRSAGYRELRARYVPPYDPGKFPNKWRKMEPDQPARTLMAHLGHDGYSHIHYDSAQARVITVREAARLQSFPDGFIFSGTMNPAFRQIGNSVPPLLSFALATALNAAVRSVNRHEQGTSTARESIDTGAEA